MMRRFSYLLALAVILVITQGCSGSQKGSGGTSATGQPAKLKMWTWKLAHVTALKQIASEFKAKTGIEVEVEAFNPDETYKTTVKAAANTGDLPDVLSYWSGQNTYELGAAGIFVELTDKVTPEWKSVFYPAAMATSYISKTVVQTAAKDPKSEIKGLKEGQIFTVPYLAGNANLIFANKTKLKEAGLDPTKAPATFEEFIDMLKATKAKDPQNGGLVTGLENPHTGLYWLYRPMAFQYLGPEKFYGRESNKSFKWNSPESLHTLELYHQLSDLWMPGVLSTNIDPADLAFAQGKAAFDVGGTYTLSFVEQQGLKADNILIFPVPAPKGGALKELVMQPMSLIDVGITKDAKNQDAALQWIKFVTSKEGAQTFAKVAHDMPATNIGSDPAVVGEQLASMFKLFKDQGVVYPTYDNTHQPPGQEVLTPQANGLAKLISKETTPDKLADQFTKLYDEAWKAVAAGK